MDIELIEIEFTMFILDIPLILLCPFKLNCITNMAKQIVANNIFPSVLKTLHTFQVGWKGARSTDN